MKKAALFLDRDGTIIVEKGYLRSPEEVEFLPGVFEALKKIKNRFLLFIVTHQPGIARGDLKPEEVEKVNLFIQNQFAKEGLIIEKIFVCPHQKEENCQCIKPKPYFLKQASQEFDIDLLKSYVIGDHPADVELARNAGAAGLYLLTGHGSKHLSELKHYFPVFNHLHEAINFILQTEAALDKASDIIRQGGVVAFPTETVYGLGADAFNPLAVARVFEIKNRPYFDPLIVHIARVEELEKLASQIPEKALKLTKIFWPGPLTLVLPKRETVPDIVTSGLPSVAVRMPRHILTLRLIIQAERPIVGPSANPFGYLSPTTAQHVREQLGSKVDFILDGGPCEIGVESTILSFLEEPPRLLRPGGIPLEEIEAIIGPINPSPEVKGRPEAPGLFARHYAPRTCAFLDWTEEDFWRWKKEGKKIGLLSFRGEMAHLPFDHLEILSPQGDLRQAASVLFASLHRLDKAQLDLILMERIPEIGLGRAIMDRLRRATSLFFQKEPSPFSEVP